MRALTKKAEQWPRTKDGELVFKTPDHALFYANLICTNKRLVDEIDLSLFTARLELKTERQKTDPDLDLLMQIAVKAQMFRECLDEVKRIRQE